MIAEAGSELYGISEILSGGVFPDSFISGNSVYNPGQFSETRFRKTDAEISSGLDTCKRQERPPDYTAFTDYACEVCFPILLSAEIRCIIRGSFQKPASERRMRKYLPD